MAGTLTRDVDRMTNDMSLLAHHTRIGHRGGGDMASAGRDTAAKPTHLSLHAWLHLCEKRHTEAWELINTINFGHRKEEKPSQRHARGSDIR